MNRYERALWRARPVKRKPNYGWLVCSQDEQSITDSLLSLASGVYYCPGLQADVGPWLRALRCLSGTVDCTIAHETLARAIWRQGSKRIELRIPPNEATDARDIHSMQAVIHETFGQNLRATWGGTSLACLRACLPQKQTYYRQAPDNEAWLRGAYYGGLCFLTSVRQEQDIVQIDANAMFASHMRNGVPAGVAIRTKQEMPGYPAFYLCHIRASERVAFTFLPERVETGARYPRGEWDAIIDSDSLTFARSVGYDITVQHGYIFERFAHPFDDFVSICERVEKSTNDQLTVSTIKHIRTSAYGMLGLTGDAQKMVLSKASIVGAQQLINPLTGEIFDDVWLVSEHFESGAMHPHWTAWITAHARLELATLVYAAGVENVVYGDTDALFVRAACFDNMVKRGIITIGQQYGAYKVEARHALFQSDAPKVWRAGHTKRSKGMPSHLLGEQASVTFRAKRGIRTALYKLAEPEITRRYSTLEASNRWVADKQGRVSPVWTGNCQAG